MQVLTLSNEDRLLQLATHWVQHGLSEPRILTDIERLWNRQHESTHKIQVGALVRRLREVGAHAAFALALLVLERQQRLVTPVSQPLRSRRAELFSKALRTLLLRAVEPGDLALRQSEQHQLRIAAWSLLTPGRVLASAWRELLPSAARLSRIAGRKLSKSEVPVYFARRQLGGIRKLWGA